MRNSGRHTRAFVMQLDPGADPEMGRFEGSVEHVALGRYIRFHSSEELIAFVVTVVTASNNSGDEPPQ